jgi:hypothetical protein
MADFNIKPIGTEVRPVQGASLGDMINLARGAQQYQQAAQINPLELQQKQQATRTGQIALGVEEQKDLERKNVMTLLSDPSKFTKNNRLDLDVLTPKLMEIAPLTGPTVLQGLTTLTNAQTTADSAASGLNQADRALLGQPLAVAGYQGIKDPNVYAKIIKETLELNKNNPRLVALGDSYLTQLQFADPNNLPDIAIRASQNLLSPAQGKTAFAPTITTTAEGKTVTTQPSIGAKAPTATMGLAGQTDPYEYKDTVNKDPISNQPIYEVKDKLSGRVVGQLIKAPEPQKQPAGFATAPTIPAGESEETGKAYQAQINAAREAGVPSKTAVNNIDTILKFLPMAQTGKASEAFAGLQSIVGNIAGSKPEELAAAARDIIQKNIVDLALQKNAALGGKFASSLEASLASLAQAEKNPTAIAKNLEQLRPLVQHPYNYTIGLDRAVEKSPNKQFTKPKFDAAMNEAFDLKALMLKNAYDVGGEEGLNKYKKENKINLVEQQKLVDKLERYQALVNGDLERYKALTDKEK